MSIVKKESIKVVKKIDIKRQDTRRIDVINTSSAQKKSDKKNIESPKNIVDNT